MAPKERKKQPEKNPAEETPKKERTGGSKKPPKKGTGPKDDAAGGSNDNNDNKNQKSKKKKRKRKPENFKRYIHKVLKQVHSGLRISTQAMSIMNSFMVDMYEKIAKECYDLVQYNKKHTITSREVQSAVRLVLPSELAKHAMAQGIKSINQYKTWGQDPAPKTTAPVA